MLRQVFMDLLGNAIKYTSRRPRATTSRSVADKATSTRVEVFVRIMGWGSICSMRTSYLGSFSGYIARRSSRAPESDWPM